jgi:hypothetical protein
MSQSKSRSLNIVPIVHSTHDLGMLKDSILAGKSEMARGQEANDGKSSVDWFWEELKKAIQARSWEFESLYLYQDALPVGPDAGGQLEHRIVSDLASKGNPNYVILSWLIDKGAKLIGTEDPSLLLEEYQLVKQTLESQRTVERPTESTTSRLLHRRDAFIANRIGETLPEKGIGLIFLGMLHQVESLLAPDIQVNYPFGRPCRESIAVVNNY